MTATAIVRVRPASVHFFEHDTTVGKRRPRCCAEWDRKNRVWLPTKHQCAHGTHDQLGCSAVVEMADPDSPHKKTRKTTKAKPPPQMIIVMQAYGEHARVLRDGKEGQLFSVRGYEMPKFYHGKWGRLLIVTEVQAVSQEAVLSRLTIAKADAERQARAMGRTA